jgi:hypothetical protein
VLIETIQDQEKELSQVRKIENEELDLLVENFLNIPYGNYEILKTKRCPVCGYSLRERSVGLVCKNHKCKIYWKYGGFAFNEKQTKNELNWDKIYKEYKNN